MSESNPIVSPSPSHFYEGATLMDIEALRSQSTSLPFVAAAHAEVWSADWSKDRIALAKVLSSHAFECVIGLVILCNTLIVIHETDLRATCDDHESRGCPADTPTFVILNTTMMSLYAIEVLVRFYTYRWKFWDTVWNRLDCFLVTVGMASELLGGLLPSLAIFRLVRVARFMKVLRIMLQHRELYLIVHGFLSAMKAIFWASILMFMLLSVWSIFAVEILHPINLRFPLDEHSHVPRPFGSVMQSNLTLFGMVLMGEGWSEVALPIIYLSPWTGVVFVGIFSTVALGFCNLILAVIVDSAAEARSEDTTYKLWVQKLNEETAKGKLTEICRTLDVDQNGLLTHQELLQGYSSSKDFVDAMKIMDVHLDELNFVFNIMRDNDSNSVHYVDFVDQLYKMRCADTRTLLMLIKLHVLELRQTVLEDITKHESSEDTGTIASGSTVLPHSQGRWDLPVSTGSETMTIRKSRYPTDSPVMSTVMERGPLRSAGAGDSDDSDGAKGAAAIGDLLLRSFEEQARVLTQHSEQLSTLNSFLPRLLGTLERRLPPQGKSAESSADILALEPRVAPREQPSAPVTPPPPPAEPDNVGELEDFFAQASPLGTRSDLRS